MQLVCGGRVMAVEWVNRQVDHPFAQAAWMSARHTLQRASIALDVLKVVSEEAQTPSTVE